LEDGELPLELLPELQELRYFGSRDTGDAFTSFIDARQNAGRPVTLVPLLPSTFYESHCGVINHKKLPCGRSITCKSHSMGAKRAVHGRSKNYDELLLEWYRAHNPNFFPIARGRLQPLSQPSFPSGSPSRPTHLI
jgi:hypothetical protein